jgi:hypothetical protein
VQVSSNLVDWIDLANAGNGNIYTDTTLTNNPALYAVRKPAIREQTRHLYVDNVPVNWNLPQDSIEAYLGPGAFQSWPSKNGGQFRTNGWFWADTFMFGGFLRSAGEGGFVNASFSDAAVWNRALSSDEIAAFIRDGITNASALTPALFANLSAEFPAAVQGDTDLVSWTASKSSDALTLDPGNNDVMPLSSFGIGSSNVTVNADTIFTLVATRGGSSVTSSPVTVNCVSNVAANWHWVDGFTYLNNGPIRGQGGWLNPVNGPATHDMGNMNVYAAGSGNKYVGFDGFDTAGTPAGVGAIAGHNLFSFKSTPGNSNTVFFRFYIDPAATNNDPYFGYILPISLTAGLNDIGIVDVGIVAAGPSFTIAQPSGGGPINLTANSGASGITVDPNTYDYLTDTNTGDTNGIIAGHVYSVWMDVINNYPGVVGGWGSTGEQTNAAFYAVWLQRDDWAARTNLFSAITCTNVYGGTMYGTNYPTGYLLSPRDYSADDQVNKNLGPSANLSYVLLWLSTAGSTQATNAIRLDDFYISKTGAGFNSTVPVAAGGF